MYDTYRLRFMFYACFKTIEKQSRASYCSSLILALNVKVKRFAEHYRLRFDFDNQTRYRIE